MRNSKTKFEINTVGLITNILLDPVLILGWFGFSSLFLYRIIKNDDDYFKIKIYRN